MGGKEKNFNAGKRRRRVFIRHFVLLRGKKERNFTKMRGFDWTFYLVERNEGKGK